MIARGKALTKELAPMKSSGMGIAPAIATVERETPVARNAGLYSMNQPWLTISD
jgi:hypothetical protein